MDDTAMDAAAGCCSPAASCLSSGHTAPLQGLEWSSQARIAALQTTADGTANFLYNSFYEVVPN